jgi:hypothetical protein
LAVAVAVDMAEEIRVMQLILVATGELLILEVPLLILGVVAAAHTIMVILLLVAAVAVEA